jgi:DivIVA domain-containing protein
VTLVLVLVAICVVAGVAAVAAGRVRGGLEDPPPARPYRPLPPPPLVPSDVDALQFSLALRGYRMGEVDEALAQLRDALADRDMELAALHKRLEVAERQPDDQADEGEGR